MQAFSTRAKVLGIATIASLALVSGCGGGNDGGGGGGGDTKEFIIGIGVPLTQGDVAFGQGIKRATELAVKKANESEEVKAAKISFKTLDGDDQSDPKTGTTVANKFASTKNLVGVVGHFNSTVSIAASKVYNDKNIVAISPGSTNPTLTEQGFASIFRTTATDAVQGPVGAERAFNLGYKTVAVVNDSSTYGEGLAKEFGKKFAELGGSVVLEANTQQKQNDFTALATKIAALAPDVVYFGGTYAADTGAGALFSKQLKAGGVTAPVMGGDGLYADDFISLAGNADGDLATCPGLPPELLPKGAEFSADYKAAYPNDPVAAFDAYAYDAAQSLINAAVKVATDLGANTITSPDGKAAMIDAVTATDFEGVTGQVSFDEKGDTKNQAVSLYKVEAGAWVPQAAE
jgi:branched-chain amino acid transport system substrate-binding protein